MKINGGSIDWLGHAGFRINIKEKVIYIDPYQISDKNEKADLILITHSHYDHCSQQDIEKIAKDDTVVICTADSQSKIARIKQKIRIELVEPGIEILIEDIKIRAIEAYNIGKTFHPKADNYVGYILQFDKIIIYHAGDTDAVKEIEKLTGYAKKGNHFIVLLPVGGTYTMNAEEAAKVAFLLKPTLAIPMHYGSIIGSIADAEKFCSLCREKGIKAEILEKV